MSTLVPTSILHLPLKFKSAFNLRRACLCVSGCSTCVFKDFASFLLTQIKRPDTPLDKALAN